MVSETLAQTLIENDLNHLIHPLYHRSAQENAVILESGDGVWLTDINGKRYIDALSSLWNVNVGHGRAELGEAAARQIKKLAFNNSYTGFANVPSIELATKLVALAPDGLDGVFFTSGGGEANESAFKMARFYWDVLGRPEKFKIIARMDAYHGVTNATMAATGIPAYWAHFGPPAPGFLHALAPNMYRLGDGTPASTTREAINSIEQIVEREGADTIAAIVAEPVQGAGGVIVPPDDYLPALRALCDRCQILLIADEIITGFGRLGTWFGVDRYGIVPDLMTFAKGVTSGYVQLGGLMVSRGIQDALAEQPAGVRWMHAYTYSAHPVACAVGLANLAIIEREQLVERAARMGEVLLTQLRTLEALPCVGDVRGLGLMARIELVQDKESKQPYPDSAHVGDRVLVEARERGLLTRNRGDVICLAPPLIVAESEIDEIVTILHDSIATVVRGL